MWSLEAILGIATIKWLSSQFLVNSESWGVGGRGGPQNCYLRLFRTLSGRVPLEAVLKGKRLGRHRNRPSLCAIRQWEEGLDEQGAFTETWGKKSLPPLEEGAGDSGRVQGCCYEMQRD